ncbi:hypothetical protein DA2_0819 [Desulfovibrio sp. A2]|nr:hypothetical protein DA2_0819 [Desulfovibrio sp. A2]
MAGNGQATDRPRSRCRTALVRCDSEGASSSPAGGRRHGARRVRPGVSGRACPHGCVRSGMSGRIRLGERSEGRAEQGGGMP